MKVQILGSHLNASVKSYFIYTFSTSFAFWGNYGVCTYFHNMEWASLVKNGKHFEDELNSKEIEYWRNNLLSLCSLK